jgi:hypothetical protein
MHFPFLQGAIVSHMLGLILKEVSHLKPTKPGGQKQIDSLFFSKHIPPFKPFITD